MGVEKGSAFLLKVGNGNVPATYEAVAGMRTTQLSVNGEAVNITSKDSGGWRELLSGAGVRSVSVSSGLCCSRNTGPVHAPVIAPCSA